MLHTAISSTHQVQQRYEDAIVVDQAPGFGSRHFSVWGVFDGHGGSAVSHYLAKNIVSELELRLPGPLAPDDDVQQSPSTSQQVYAEAVRRAVLAAFLSLALQVQDHLQHRESIDLSSTSGCGATATVAVQIGQLLTVANCGSIKCVLDVGHSAFECSSDHKLGNNEDEEQRLDASEWLPRHQHVHSKRIVS